MLIGPLAYKLVAGVYVVDFSKPGATERFETEEKEWWKQNEPKEYGHFNDDEF